MLKWSLCNFSDAYVHVRGTILIPNTGTAAMPNNRNKKVIFKICARFTDCISEIDNSQADNARDIDSVVSIYNLIEYSGIYSKTSESLRQHFRDESALDNGNSITNFPSNNNIILFKSKEIITGHNGAIKRSK